MPTPLSFVPSRAAQAPQAARRAADRLVAVARGLVGPERDAVLARAACQEAAAIRARYADSFLFARISRQARGGSVAQAVDWLDRAGRVRHELAQVKAAYRRLTGQPMPSPSLPPHPQPLAEPAREWGLRTEVA